MTAIVVDRSRVSLAGKIVREFENGLDDIGTGNVLLGCRRFVAAARAGEAIGLFGMFSIIVQSETPLPKSKSLTVKEP